MKSGRYKILPRVRKVCTAKEGVHYKCTWKDPGDLQQHAGWNLRFVAEYVGRGPTIQAAIESCRLAYIRKQHDKEQVYKDIDKMLADHAYAEHCIATSNLPWWRRLFRV